MSQTERHSDSLGNRFSFSLFAKLLYLVTRIALPPLVLSFVSMQEYGVWAIGFVVVSFLGLSTAGFSAVYIREAALWAREGDTQRLNEMVSTGVLSLLVLGVVLSGGVWLAVPHLIGVFKIAPEHTELATWSLVGCCWIFLVDMCLGASAWLLQGMGQFVKEQKVWVVSYLIEWVVAVTALFNGLGIYSLLLAFGIRYAFSLSANAMLARRAIPGLKIQPALWRSSHLKQFAGYGALVQVSSICGTLFHAADRLLAGLLVGPAATALVDLAAKLPSTAISIPSAINGAILPMASSQEGKQRELLDLSERASQWILYLLIVPMPFLAAFSQPVLTLWLGNTPHLIELAPAMSAFCVGWHIHVLTGPASAIARGTGRAQDEYPYHLFRGCTYSMAIGYVLLFQTQTLVELALAFSTAVVVAALGYLALAQHRNGLPLRQLLSKKLSLVALGYPVAWASHQLIAPLWATPTDRFTALRDVLLGGSLYVGLLLPILWFFVLSQSERLAVIRLVNTTLTRFHFNRLPS